jgi:hypothetical protein
LTEKVSAFFTLLGQQEKHAKQEKQQEKQQLTRKNRSLAWRLHCTGQARKSRQPFRAQAPKAPKAREVTLPSVRG